MPTLRPIGSPQTRIEQQAAKVFIAQVGSLERAVDILQQIHDGKPTEDELERQHVNAAMDWAAKQMRPMPHRLPEVLALYEQYLRGKGPQPSHEPPPLEHRPSLRAAVSKRAKLLKK